MQAPIYSDKAREIMRKMGHAAGEGLGKLSKGILELRDWNHSTPLLPRSGLGYVPKKDKSKPKPEVVCFNDPSIPAGREPSRTGFTFAHIKTHQAKPPQLSSITRGYTQGSCSQD